MDLSHGGSKSINNKEEEVVMPGEPLLAIKGGHHGKAMLLNEVSVVVEPWQMTPVAMRVSLADIIAEAIFLAAMLKKHHLLSFCFKGVEIVVARDSDPKWLGDEFKRMTAKQPILRKSIAPYLSGVLVVDGVDTRYDC